MARRFTIDQTFLEKEKDLIDHPNAKRGLRMNVARWRSKQDGRRIGNSSCGFAAERR